MKAAEYQKLDSVHNMEEDIDASTVSKTTFDLEDYDVKEIFVDSDVSDIDNPCF